LDQSHSGRAGSAAANEPDWQIGFLSLTSLVIDVKESIPTMTCWFLLQNLTNDSLPEGPALRKLCPTSSME
jgi:hypothetical protein